MSRCMAWQGAKEAHWKTCRSRKVSWLAPVWRGGRPYASGADAEAEAGAGGGVKAGPSQHWDEITDRMVGAASIPFSILVLPQVLQNFANISASNAAALSAISWEGYVSGLVGNTLMCGHFSGMREKSAVNVQLLGMVNNLMVLGQMAYVSVMPCGIFLAVAAVTVLAAVVGLARLAGKLDERSKGGGKPSGFGFWQCWQLATGVAGLAVVPQVMYNILVPAHPSSLPGLVTLLALMAFFASKFRTPESQQQAGSMVESLPGWAATLLFALSPLPQLVRNFLDAPSLEGLSAGTMVLALLGNALMVPRAIWTKDRIWSVGTLWACTAGWGQLLSLYLGHSSVTGMRYLSQNVFVAVTVVLLGHLILVARTDAQAKGVPSVLAAIKQIMFDKAL